VNVNVVNEDEKAHDAQPATKTADAELLERKQKELDAPRQHALRCARTAPPGTPIYYMDTLGAFQELGKERVRRAPVAEEPRVKRARCVEVKVWGPDEKRKLTAGEWEMEERIVAR
jgi:hypothetical protein